MTEEIKDDGFVIDISKWRIRNFRNFINAVRTNDFDAMAAEASQVVLQWPYAGEPSDPEAFMNLYLNQYPEIIRAINVEMEHSFSKGN